MEQATKQPMERKLEARVIINTLRQIATNLGTPEQRAKEAKETRDVGRLTMLSFDTELNTLYNIATNPRASARALNNIAYTLVYSKRIKQQNMTLAVDTAFAVMDHAHAEQKTWNVLADFKSRGLSRALLGKMVDSSTKEKIAKELGPELIAYLRQGSSNSMASA